MLHAIFQTFNGSSLAGSKSFDAHGLGWVSTADYLGVIVVVLAVVALIIAAAGPPCWAFGAVAVIAGCLVYFSPLVSRLNRLPGLQEIRWVRSIQILGFALSILAGVGLDALVRSRGDRQVRNVLGAGFAAMAVLLALLWAFGRGASAPRRGGYPSRSFIWPAVEVVIGLAVFVLSGGGAAGCAAAGTPTRPGPERSTMPAGSQQ